ncbi:DUF4386 domain-containing protein [Glaciibacter superstes]|uniref:DUF4386 domain-containing protein n=1 Tax=Glaciibacter superstes TaxID=501023 RepID=UPI0003B4E7E9|nr:DUF4386 domain-containing protein [Glaciibacter superstes]
MSTTQHTSNRTDLSLWPAGPNFTRWSPRTAALVSGVALALMAVLGGWGNFGAIVPLITPGDATATATAISESSGLFLAGILSLFIVTGLDFIVAGAWYTLFKPVRSGLSAVAAWLRVVYTLLFIVSISQLVIGFSLLGDPEAALPALERYNTMWVISLGLFGLHLLLIGYLAFRSGFVPRVFGILLVIAGLGYLADAFGMVFISDYTATVATFTFVGEVAIIFWLLIAGRRLSAHTSVAAR